MSPILGSGDGLMRSDSEGVTNQTVGQTHFRAKNAEKFNLCLVTQIWRDKKPSGERAKQLLVSRFHARLRVSAIESYYHRKCRLPNFYKGSHRDGGNQCIAQTGMVGGLLPAFLYSMAV